MSKKGSKRASERQAIVEFSLVVAGALAYNTVLEVVIYIIFSKWGTARDNCPLKQY